MKISYRYLGRYREIASVLIKYGFGFIIDKFNGDSGESKVNVNGPKPSVRNMSTGQRIRYACEDLGPTFIKIAQIVSTRTDIFDEDITSELSKLRDNVEPFDNAQAMEILEKELDTDIYNVFRKIDSEPIAAASIGQVYSGYLKNGDRVVVKIQRPDIEEKIKADISILKNIASSLTSFKKEYNVDICELISELEVQLLRELDYKFEAVNGIKLGKIFEHSREVFIPKIYADYTTKKILIMEKVEGICFSDISKHNISDEEKKRIVDIGVRSFFRQVMTCGFFHADPHPGNIFLLEDGRLSYVDFGMIGIIDDKMLSYLNQLIISSTDKNVDRIVRVLTDMGAIKTEINYEALKRDLLYLIHYYYDIPFDKLSIAEILNEVFSFMRKHRIELPSQLVILGKTTITLEGTSRGLYKKFSVEVIASSYLKYYKQEKLDLKRQLKSLKSNIDDYYYDIVTVPSQLKNILSILEKNSLKLNMEEIRIPGLTESIRKFTTQITMSIMLAACIIGSSLILSSKNIQSSQTIKIVGICGFILSFIIGITLVFLILKNNYRKK